MDLGDLLKAIFPLLIFAIWIYNAVAGQGQANQAPPRPRPEPPPRPPEPRDWDFLQPAPQAPPRDENVAERIDDPRFAPADDPNPNRREPVPGGVMVGRISGPNGDVFIYPIPPSPPPPPRRTPAEKKRAKREREKERKRDAGVSMSMPLSNLSVPSLPTGNLQVAPLGGISDPSSSAKTPTFGTAPVNPSLERLRGMLAEPGRFREAVVAREILGPPVASRRPFRIQPPTRD